MGYNNLKTKVQQLRSEGKTYTEISVILKYKIPKSTLSYWCKKIQTPPSYSKKIKKIININAAKGRLAAVRVNKIKRQEYLQKIYNSNIGILKFIKGSDVAKLILAALYLGEGSKTRKGAIHFGNSDPGIIKLFLKLLRQVYKIDETKFRITIQCRADQNTKVLENFWQILTKISKKQFYTTRIDPRTIGKPSKKKNYKGVCCVDYFSADVYNELMIIGNILTN